jgi:CheY-like chemotaxis protein
MIRRKILCVDDEQPVLDGLRRNLRNVEFDLLFANSGEQALQVLAAETGIAVLLSDLRMPGMGGIGLMEKVAERWPDVTRVMLTGNADQQSAVDAVNRGHVFSFQNKPCPPEVLLATLRAALAHHELRLAERELIEQTLTGAIRMLIEIMSSGQPALYGRAMKVRGVALELMALAGRQVNSWQLGMAALLQPIGWAALPSSVVEQHLAGSVLDEAHQAAVEGVGAASARLLHFIPRLNLVADIISQATDHADLVPVRSAEAALLWLANQLVDEDAESRVDDHVVAAHSAAGIDLGGVLRAWRLRHAADRPKAADDFEILTISRPAQLRPGDIVQRDVRFTDGTLALAAGGTLSAFQIERLEMHHLLNRIKAAIEVRRPKAAR